MPPMIGPETRVAAMSSVAIKVNNLPVERGSAKDTASPCNVGSRPSANPRTNTPIY
jgi:hypothetical protein